MGSSTNRRWIIPFKKFSRLSIMTALFPLNNKLSSDSIWSVWNIKGKVTLTYFFDFTITWHWRCFRIDFFDPSMPMLIHSIFDNYYPVQDNNFMLMNKSYRLENFNKFCNVLIYFCFINANLFNLSISPACLQCSIILYKLQKTFM